MPAFCCCTAAAHAQQLTLDNNMHNSDCTTCLHNNLRQWQRMLGAADGKKECADMESEDDANLHKDTQPKMTQMFDRSCTVPSQQPAGTAPSWELQRIAPTAVMLWYAVLFTVV
jgi:hypothetical protein